MSDLEILGVELAKSCLAYDEAIKLYDDWQKKAEQIVRLTGGKVKA